MADGQIGPARLGLLAGFTAAVAAVAAMVALRLALGVPTVPELLAERFTAFIPLALFDLALGLLGPLAKRLLVGSFFAGQVAVGALAGLLYLRLRPGLPSAALLSSALAALVLLVVMPIGGAGFFGAGLPAGPSAAVAATVVMTAVFGFVLWAVIALTTPRPLPAASEEAAAGAADLVPAAGPALTRRQFVASAVATVAVVAVGVGMLRRGSEASLPVARSAAPASTAQPAGTPTPDDLAALPPEVTPIDDFYVVSKNFLVDPVVKVENWSLKVMGPREVTLTYDDLLKLESQTQWGTLECISNEVGGSLISNQSWKGVPLRTLLEMAGIGSDAQRIAIHAEDQYVDSIDINKALEPHTILAYEMGGSPLTSTHGFPARLIVPDIYGMKNVKWVNKIEVVPADFMGYWQQRGWSQTAVVQTMSRIDLPRTYSKPLPLGPIQIGGIAFAGSRGIQAVEYSTDGGATWNPASVKPPLSPRSWALWTATWTPVDEGDYMLLARAIDGKGEIQTDKVASPLPDGATGYHTVRLSVRAQA